MEKWETDLAEALRKSLSSEATEDGEEDDPEDQVEELLWNERRMVAKLERVAGILAEAGIIHNTPTAKQEWIYS